MLCHVKTLVSQKYDETLLQAHACGLTVALTMPRFSRKRALGALFACVVTSSIYSYASHTGHSKTSISVDDTATRANALHSPRLQDVESLRNVSGRASPVGSFDFEFAKLKFQRVVNASAVGGTASIAPASISCDFPINDSARVLTDNFSEIVGWASAVRRESKLVHSVKSSVPRVFVTGLLHNSCELMQHYVVEVLKFILLYDNDEGFENVFVSLYSSGDGDCAVLTLEAFKDLLDAIGVPNVIKTRQRERIPGTARIDFLQSIRNAAMEPLYLSDTPYDEVVFLSDAFFCAGDIVRLLRHTEASIKCGLDFDGTTNAMKFRDTWVAHDMSGRMFTKEFPFVHDVASSHALNSGAPFQVSCCWNGLLTLRAKVFTDLGARFRRSLDDTECHAAETELICHDFAALGHPKMLVDPQVTVTYTKAEYIALSNSHSSAHSYSLRRTNMFTNESIATVETWAERPSSTECAPLDGHAGDHPDRGRIRHIDWNTHYAKMGVPVASEKTTTTLHVCDGPSASQCVMSGGKRAFVLRHALDG